MMQQNKNSYTDSPLRVLSIIFAIVIQNYQQATAEDSNIFLYNTIDRCKKTEHFDVNYFKCKSCDAALMLEPAEDSKKIFSLRLRICCHIKTNLWLRFLHMISLHYFCRTLMPLLHTKRYRPY